MAARGGGEPAGEGVFFRHGDFEGGCTLSAGDFVKTASPTQNFSPIVVKTQNKSTKLLLRGVPSDEKNPPPADLIDVGIFLAGVFRFLAYSSANFCVNFLPMVTRNFAEDRPHFWTTPVLMVG